MAVRVEASTTARDVEPGMGLRFEREQLLSRIRIQFADEIKQSSHAEFVQSLNARLGPGKQRKLALELALLDAHQRIWIAPALTLGFALQKQLTQFCIERD